jgi:hypothetical protein
MRIYLTEVVFHFYGVPFELGGLGLGLGLWEIGYIILNEFCNVIERDDTISLSKIKCLCMSSIRS